MERQIGGDPLVEIVERSPRTFDSVPAITAFLRRQLFIAEGGEKDTHFRAILPERITNRDGGWTLAERPAGSLGIVTWDVTTAGTCPTGPGRAAADVTGKSAGRARAPGP